MCLDSYCHCPAFPVCIYKGYFMIHNHLSQQISLTLSFRAISGFIHCLYRQFRHADSFLSQPPMSHCFSAWGPPLVGQFWGVFHRISLRILSPSSLISQFINVLILAFLPFPALLSPLLHFKGIHWDHLPGQLAVRLTLCSGANSDDKTSRPRNIASVSFLVSFCFLKKL